MKGFWGNENKYLRIRYSQINISFKMTVILLGVAGTLIIMVFTVSDVGFINLWKAQKKLDRMKNEIDILEKETSLLEQKVVNLKNDPFALEKIAREKYGYIKPGDKVFKIKIIPERNNNTLPSSFLDISNKK